MNFYSGKDGKRILRNLFPKHLMMNYFQVSHPHMHPICDREFWDALPEQIKAPYIAAAAELLDFEWKVVPAYDVFLYYAQTGKRDREKLAVKMRDALVTLAIGECMENSGRFLPAIINGIFAICEQTTWATAAHFKACSLSVEDLPSPEDPILDLYAAGQGYYLAMVYAWMKPKLDEISPVICRRIRREMDIRIFKPYLERNDLWWMGFETDLTFWNINNWTTACNYEILFAALAMELDRKTAYAVVNRAIESLDVFVDAYPEDGSCDEGPGYWFGAVGNLLLAVELLDHVTGGKGHHRNSAKLANMVDYMLNMRIDGDLYASVADAHCHGDPSYGKVSLLYHCGEMFDREEYRQEALELYQHVKQDTHVTEFVLSRLLYMGELAKKVPCAKRKCAGWMPGVQIMVARSSEKANQGFYLCVKGGHNAESHNHNDIGGVIVYKNGKPVVVDAGVESYTSRTFGEHRYENWWARSVYHSVPSLGAEQKDGAEYAAKHVEYKHLLNGEQFALELKDAYQNRDQIESLHRTVSLNRDSDTVEIVDRYHAQGALPLEETLILAQEPRIEADCLLCGDARISWAGSNPQISVEKIDCSHDANMSHSWGNALYAVRLQLQPSAEGSMRIVIE